MLSAYFKSIIDQDWRAVVVCGVDHTILYLNPAAAAQYKKWGGAALVGQSLLACHNAASCAQIQRVVDWFAADESHNRVFTHHNPRQNKDVYMVALRDETGALIGYYEQQEFRTPETAPAYDMK